MAIRVNLPSIGTCPPVRHAAELVVPSLVELLKDVVGEVGEPADQSERERGHHGCDQTGTKRDGEEKP